MRFTHHNFEFEVPDEWWAEAGMEDFVPNTRSYIVKPLQSPGQNIYEVPVEEVAPVRRNLSHGVFNNDSETGLSAKDRVVRILRGFVSGAALPPVEVVAIPPSALYQYKLTHGAHRFYLSIAARFTHVPAIDGFDLSSLDND